MTGEIINIYSIYGIMKLKIKICLVLIYQGADRYFWILEHIHNYNSVSSKWADQRKK